MSEDKNRKDSKKMEKERTKRQTGRWSRTGFLERIEAENSVTVTFDDKEAERRKRGDGELTGGKKSAAEKDRHDIVFDVAENGPLRAGRVEMSELKSSKLSGDRKTVGRGLRILLTFLILLFAICGWSAYRFLTAASFPDSAKIDGVDVGGLNAKESEKAVTAGANRVILKRHGEKAVESKTAYTFELKREVSKYIKIASVDPRFLIGRGADYTIPLKVKGGHEETAEMLKQALPNPKGAVITRNAYIDYDKMKLVEAVQGVDLNYVRLAEAIAKEKLDSPKSFEFEFNPEDYLNKPDVKASDLRKEFAFAKKYIAGGLILRCDTGDVTVTPAQLAKVIKYSKDGPKYDMKGAREVASEISSSYSPWRVVVRTQEGARTLNNYILSGEVDIEATAKSIYKAAKEGTDGRIFDNMNADASLEDRVEVSIGSQTLYVVQGGKVTNTWPVVTGLPGRDTVPGIFNIFYKQSPAKLIGDESDPYEIPVKYWMAFNGGAGLHDAVWQSSFGGNAYKTRGSHGCVGMSLANAMTLYAVTYVGMPVVVY